jgi:RNA polymerase sigma-70 factor (ECF subfamily)
VVGRPLQDEDELVARAKRGDAAAYEDLVRIHQTTALRVAYLVTGNEADAQEAAQDAFVKAYRALGRFRRGASFRPWLNRIVAKPAAHGPTT